MHWRGTSLRQIGHEQAARVLQLLFQRDIGDSLLLVAAVAIIVTLGLIAALTPTTNWDSMTYHLRRIMYWIQQHSVEHYPTVNERQLESGPWSSFAMATCFILYGGDRFANLIQWFVMLSSAIGATLIARQLAFPAGRQDEVASPLWQRTVPRQHLAALTTVLAVTLPIGITQSTTTQNDYVVAFWVVCLMCFTLALKQQPKNMWYVAGTGMSIGIGMLTKSTTLFISVPIIFMLLYILLFRQSGFVYKLSAILVIAIIALLINAPHFWRNYQLFGSPMGSPGTVSIQKVEEITISGTVSNIIRNISLLTPTGFPPVDNTVSAALSKLHVLTERSLNDPGTTFPYTPFSFAPFNEISDSYAGNPYHLTITILTICASVILRYPGKRSIISYQIVVIATFVLFCSLLRWQRWGSRFQIAEYILFAPVSAIMLTYVLPKYISPIISAGLLLLACYCALFNASRPILGKREFMSWPREKQYFLLVPDLYAPMKTVAEDIIASGCQHVGLRSSSDAWEYPFWVLLQDRGFTGSIRQVFFDGYSQRLAKDDPSLCAVINIAPNPPSALTDPFPNISSVAPYQIYWSQQSSAWGILLDHVSDKQNRPYAQDQRPAFKGKQLHLTLRSVRSGQLRLKAIFEGIALSAQAPLQLEVTTSTGFHQTLFLVSELFDTTIPTPGDSQDITLTLARDTNTLAQPIYLQHLRWSWLSTEK